MADFLAGGGEMGERMRALDWSRTALGAPQSWPQSLRTAISMMLPSKAQICLFWGPEYVTVYNDAYRPVLGGKHPRMLGQPGRVAWSEIWDEVLRALLDGVVRTGEAFWAKDMLFFLDRHGFVEETYFDVSYDPVRIESGEVGGVYCIVTETTGRVVGERRLALLRDLARKATARSAREACVRAIETIAGQPEDLPYAAVYLGGELQASTPGPAPALVRELPIGAEGRLVAGLNPRRPFDEQYRAFLELVADQLASAIADAQAYDEERKRAEALAQIDRAKTAFFSNVSHEFRTPLTLMLGPLADGLVDAEQPLPPAQRARQELVLRSALRLQKLVNTLLDFSRIEAGRARASYVATDLAGFTANLASTFRSAVEKAGLELEVDCPPLPEPAWIDREMWEKIVLNLLSNAFKFTFEGRIAISVRMGEQFMLEVRDSGAGIPAAELPRIFERFHRVEGAKSRTHEGTGIGLALVQELAKLHGGAVSVHSVEGQGSTFSVSIPRGSAHLPAEHVGRASELASTALGPASYVQEALGWLADPAPAYAGETVAPAKAGARIVWADDNADMREYVRSLLAPRYDVEAVADGEAALAAVRARAPDLVLADVMMPKLDGFGLIAALRADEKLKGLPVILLSARAGEEARIEGMSAGADDYVVKPFSARELLVRVHALLQSVEQRRRIDQERADIGRLFAETPVPIAVLRGPQLVFETANAAYLEVVDGRAVLGKPLLEALPEAHGQGFDELLREVLRTGKPHVGREVRVRLRRNGVLEDTWFTFIYAPLRSADGVADRVIAIVNEVTEQVVARGRLQALADQARASREELAEFVENATIAMHRVGPDGTILWANRAELDMMGYAPEHYIGRNIAEFHADPETIADILARLSRDEKLFNYEARLKRRDGAIRHVLINSSVLWREGKFVHTRCFTRDITERKRAEEDLARELAAARRLQEASVQLLREDQPEALYEHILDAAVGIMRADFASIQMLHPERGELRLLGSRGLSAQDCKLWEWVGPASGSSCAFAMGRGARVVIEDVEGTDFMTPEAVRAYLRAGIRAMQSTPLFSRGGTLQGMISTHWREPRRPAEHELRLFDVLARQAADLIERSHIQQQLVEADRRKNEFLAMLSHELRNPLAPIANAVSLLREPALEPEVAARAHGILERQLKHLIRLVDDLLDMARISRGEIGLQKRPVSLAQVLTSAVETSRPLIESGAHELVLGQAPASAMVFADPVRLAQVIANLLNNAAKYTPRGGRIELAVSAAHGSAAVTVRDNGVGIEPAELPRLFEMYTQSEATRGRVPGGLGIGLALARQLAELHGGTLEGRSDGPGRGAEFTLRVPLIAAGKPQAVAEKAQPLPAAARRILVVEDNLDAAEGFAAHLRLHGHEVRTAADGEEALAIAREFCPQVALVDSGLPGMSGYELAHRLRDTPALLIALTGHGQKQDRTRAREAGFHHHFVKPADPRDIQAAIGEWRPS